MKTPVMVLSRTFAAALLAAGCAGTPEASAPSAERIRDACIRAEMPAAMEKFKDEGAKAEGSARVYAGLICGFVANQCAKVPGAPECQRDLKRYGLLP